MTHGPPDAESFRLLVCQFRCLSRIRLFHVSLYRRRLAGPQIVGATADRCRVRELPKPCHLPLHEWRGRLQLCLRDCEPLPSALQAGLRGHSGVRHPVPGVPTLLNEERSLGACKLPTLGFGKRNMIEQAGR